MTSERRERQADNDGQPGATSPLPHSHPAGTPLERHVFKSRVFPVFDVENKVGRRRSDGTGDVSVIGTSVAQTRHSAVPRRSLHFLSAGGLFLSKP